MCMTVGEGGASGHRTRHVYTDVITTIFTVYRGRARTIEINLQEQETM